MEGVGRERDRQTDRQMDRQTETQGERERKKRDLRQPERLRQRMMAIEAQKRVRQTEKERWGDRD